MSCKAPTALEKLISEAEAAYHNLQMGTAVVEIVDQNGERVRFNPGNRQNLYLYIQQLKSKLPCEQGTLFSPNAPAGFFF